MGVNFDGSNDRINCGTAVGTLSATALTIGCRIKFTSLPTGGGDQFHIMGRWAGSGQRVIACRVVDSTTIRVLTNAVFDDITVSALSTGVWYSMIWVYAAGSGDFYLNSTDQGNYTGLDATLDSDSTAEFTIGRDSGDFGASDVVISEAFVYGVSDLTQPEIDALAKSNIKGMPLQIRTASLLAYWALDDHPSNDSADSANTLVFKDQSANSNNGTATGCNAQAEEVLSYSPGPIFPAFNIDAAGGVTVTPDVISLFLQQLSANIKINTTILSATLVMALQQLAVSIAAGAITQTDAQELALKILTADIATGAGITVATDVQELALKILTADIATQTKVLVNTLDLALKQLQVAIQTGEVVTVDVQTLRFILNNPTISGLVDVLVRENLLSMIDNKVLQQKALGNRTTQKSQINNRISKESNLV